MSDLHKYSPLLSPDSPLDARSRQLIENLNDQERKKALTLPTDDPLDTKRRDRVELTWDEIWTQPEAIQGTLDKEAGAIREAASRLGSQPVNRVIMAGCGDSLTSMFGVRDFFESVLGISCEPVQALDFVYYYHRPIDEQTLVIVLSSSGTTTRTVEALLLARAKGAQSLALSNTPESPLMSESDHRVLIHAERKGWPTQSSTAAMAVLYQFCLEFARIQGRNGADTDHLEEALHSTPMQVSHVLHEHNEAVKLLAIKEAPRPLYLYAGGGPAYAAAFFGAAKVKELSPDHAIAIPLEEYHHYNSQKAGDPLFLIAPTGPSLPRAFDTAREGHRWGGQVYSVVSEGDDTLDEVSDAQFVLPAMEESLTPIVYSAPVQLFAYHVAMAKFRLAERAVSDQ